MAPSRATEKRLCVVSKDICAFPDCHHTIVDPKTGSITGIISHIEGKKRGSSRHNQNQTDEKRDAFENLIMLCPIHHKIIDDNPEIYTVEKLKEMKKQHEEKDHVPQASLVNEFEKIDARFDRLESLILKRRLTDEE